MKKTLFFLMFIAGVFVNTLSAQVVLQSDFETWTGIQAVNGWDGSKTNIIATPDSAKKDSVGPYHGTYCVKLVNATTSGKRFSTQSIAVTAGTIYNVRFWVKGAGSIKAGLYGVKYATGGGYESNPSYIAVNSTTWSVYNQQVTADSTNANAQFLFYVKSTVAASGSLALDSVTITNVGIIPNVSLYNVQYTTANPANSLYQNKFVTTGGIVTAVYNGTTPPISQSGYYVQTRNANAWAALNVYDYSHLVSVGDSITFSGMVIEYYNETEIQQITNFTKVSSGNQALTPPTLVGLNTIQNEQYEGMLIKVKDVTDVRYNATSAWYVFSDSTITNLVNSEDTVDNIIYTYTYTQNKKYDITGVVHFEYANWIEPRNINDIDSIHVTGAGVWNYPNNFADMNIYPNPSSGVFSVTVNAIADENRSEIELTDITGRLIYKDQIDIHSGKSSLQFNMNGIEKGVYFLGIGNAQSRTVKKIIIQ